MASKNSDFIDIKGLLHQYISKWYYFVISVIVCCALGYAFIKIKQPQYAVQANLLIAQDGGDPMMANPLDALFGSQGYVEDEIFVVSSHTVYADVAKKLGIYTEYLRHDGLFKKVLEYPNPAFSLSVPENIMDTLSMGMKFTVSVDKGSNKADIKGKFRKHTVVNEKGVTLPATVQTPIGPVTIAKTDYFPTDEDQTYTINLSGYDDAAESLAEDVNVEIASKKSNVIALSMKTTNTDYGKAVLNEIIAQYNERGILQKNNQGLLTDNFLDSRISLLATELDKTETSLQKYKQEKGIINIEYEAKYQSEKKGKVEESYIMAQTELELMRMTLSFLSDKKNKYEQIPVTFNDETVGDAVKNLNALNIQRLELMESAHPNNDALLRLERRIDITRDNFMGMLQSAINQQQVRVNDLQKEINAANGTMTSMPEVERDLRNFYRQQQVQQQLYLFLLQRREENSMLLANAVPKGQVIDQAYTLSRPLGMSKMVIMFLALMLGMCIPPILLYIRRVFHNRFETRQDVERITDVPILGEMCTDHSGEKIVVASDATSSSAELFRLMRSNLMFVLNDANDKVVLLTSSTSGEGKSFISINLAASLALLKKRVLLVGMDIRNPRLSEYLDIHPRFGLTQYLASSDMALQDIIVKAPEVDDLDVIVAGPVPPNPAELLLSDKVDRLFAQLRTMYDFIIVDTAPIGLVSDTFTLNRIADASIYVCRANYTSLSDLSILNDIFEQARLKKLSVVINGTATNKTYGYGKKKARTSSK
ncbi:MAG: polysaccharide biosynthesis tyrosine autokinase [Muribaculaceae bacterium]|nr:polysaccharide biosynthesis tyrosine autokinase [Muribaculaceae bacterium]